jgi:hypothetical protein
MTYLYVLVGAMAFMAIRDLLGARKAAKAYAAVLEKKKMASKH